MPTSLPLGAPKRSPANGRGTYGFNWWTKGVRGNGTRFWLGAPPSSYAARGFNNNWLFVFPDWRMVIVRLGQDQVGGFGIHHDTWSEFLRQVNAARLPASSHTQ